MIMDDVEQEGLNFSRFKFPKDKFLVSAIVLVLLGFFLAAYGVGMFLHNQSGESNDIKIIEASASASVGTIFVHVDGEVARPGVYQLKNDARVNDAISAAGGLTLSAAGERVNLAAKLVDGQKIHIPSVDDTGSSGTDDTGAGMQSSGLISVNSATEAELDKLPGIGPVTAAKIIGGRPYASVDELLTKKAVGKSTFEKIKGMIGL